MWCAYKGLQTARRVGAGLAVALAISWAFAGVLVCGPAAAAGVPTAVFGFEFFDDTLDTRPEVQAEQAARLKLVNAELARLIAESGEMAPVDLQGEAARIAELAPFYKCNGCEEEIAGAAGARLEVLGMVRKLSNLILTFTIRVKEVGGAEKVVRGGQVDIRGNTDESWLRGVRYLMKNRILAPGQPPLDPR
ncbi:DUF3280 domain-containing protein [Xanthobacter oligotrophicus]|uniref:DUF3280 domain-containing protein n=1 Tax=Xanthobacter oligotrophicus TaxID=2607286 RepID=UPI0011F2CBDD|nr:DUF3280 domain-containing protein [Xanthobacter oligotrophicus]MCG5235113.1 DUF3280 domain-containing protein [Xanthobacter oligotrophicus]